MRTLMLLRHAQAEDFCPGATDHDRRLTHDGEQQAAELGSDLGTVLARLDLVVCSSAERARQTVRAMHVDAPVAICERLYNAGGGEILVVIRALADDIGHVLVVGHAPALPAVVHDLADSVGSDPEALATINRRFPAGALATMRVSGPWSDLVAADLVSVRLP